MKKSTLTAVAISLALTGCASLKYPGWEEVKVVDSVFKQPCRFGIEEHCTEEGSANCRDWYKKRATKNNANTVEFKTGDVTGRYFYCAAGIPPFIAMPESIWIVRNKFNPTASLLDYEKTNAKCSYEISKAALGTDVVNPERAVIIGTSGDPLMSLSNTLSQISANQANEINAIHRARKLRSDISALYEKCLGADGFISTHTDDEPSFNLHKKSCPSLASHTEPCFIPGAAQ